MKKLKEEFGKTKLLLRSVPSIVIVMFAVAVVAMNLLANKTIVSLNNANGDQWFALDGGIVVSWAAFLSMDIITKRFGPKAATRVSVVATIVNLILCALFFVVSKIPSSADDYTKFNEIFGGTWFILLDSTIAFLVSAVVNNSLNWAVGKMFKKNPNGKLAYYTRSFVSTAAGQFLDNLIFAVLTFMVFAPIFWDGFSWTFTACVTCALTGAIVELLCEVIFSPVGYRITKQWEVEKVGQQYIDTVGLN